MTCTLSTVKRRKRKITNNRNRKRKSTEKEEEKKKGKEKEKKKKKKKKKQKKKKKKRKEKDGNTDAKFKRWPRSRYLDSRAARQTRLIEESKGYWQRKYSRFRGCDNLKK